MHDFSYPCGFFKGYALQMAGPPLTLLDGSDRVIAQTEAMSARQVRLGHDRCTFEYPFGIRLPRRNTYRIEVTGMGMSRSVTVSYAELESRHFRVNVPLC